MSKAIFIVGAGRSATTALSKALALSPEAVSLSEPSPHLNEKSRHKFQGYCSAAYSALSETIGPRLVKAYNKGMVYIEKQVSLVPFLIELYNLYNAKFIVPFRDPLTTVESLLKWHYTRYPIIYREANNEHPFSPGAAAIEARLNASGHDPFDYSLPRPRENDPYALQWATMTRFEMCCWYWNRVYTAIFEQYHQLPKECFYFVNTSQQITADDLRGVYKFCDLHHFDSKAVQDCLSGWINKSASITPYVQTAASPSNPTELSPAEFYRLRDLCQDACELLGLQIESPLRNQKQYGDFWKKKQLDVAWYKEIFDYRRHSHDKFTQWINHTARKLGACSFMEIGVGLHSFYREHVFCQDRFVGIDLINEVADHLNAINKHSHHTFLCDDIALNSKHVSETCDLVFTHASIDNSDNITGFLRGLVNRTNDLLFISNYRGYFPRMSAHRRAYNEDDGVSFNDISPVSTVQILQRLGMKSVYAVPYLTCRGDIKEETAIFASRKQYTYDELVGDFPTGRCFKPYISETSDIPIDEITHQVNSQCFYYSDEGHGCASPLDLFETFLTGIAERTAQLDFRLKNFKRKHEPVNNHVAVRVDIDDDFVTAVAMAQIASRMGVAITFYILPTAPYYGYWKNDLFVRYQCTATWANSIQELGHEIGLHVDPYFYYREKSVNGADATRNELQWLRSQGLNIVGVTGHNCASYNGVESVEIFSEYQRGERRAVRTYGMFAHTGELSASELGICYEGSFFQEPEGGSNPESSFVNPEHFHHGFISSPSWMRQYLADNEYAIYGASNNIWITGRNEWISCGRAGSNVNFKHGCSLDDTLLGLRAIRDVDTLFVVHPNYFGLRRSPNEGPEY